MSTTLNKIFLITLLLSATFVELAKLNAKNKVSLSLTSDEDPCGDEEESSSSSVWVPESIEDGIMTCIGRFMDCQDNRLIQFATKLKTPRSTYKLQEISEGEWTITNKSNYLVIMNPNFLCGFPEFTPAMSTFEVDFPTVNSLTMKIHPKYASAKNYLMGSTASEVTQSETFFFTSIKQPSVPQISVIPAEFCRNADCSQGVLRFHDGWWVNPILHICPQEKKFYFFTYELNGEKFVILGYGKETAEYYWIVTPCGKLEVEIQSKTRYSLFKLIDGPNGTFKLQAWNGQYVGHSDNVDGADVVLRDDADAADILFGNYQEEETD